LIFSKYAKKSKYVLREFTSIISPEYDPIIVRIILRLDDTILWPLANNFKYHIDISEDTIEDVMKEIL